MRPFQSANYVLTIFVGVTTCIFPPTGIGASSQNHVVSEFSETIKNGPYNCQWILGKFRQHDMESKNGDTHRLVEIVNNNRYRCLPDIGIYLTSEKRKEAMSAFLYSVDPKYTEETSESGWDFRLMKILEELNGRKLFKRETLKSGEEVLARPTRAEYQAMMSEWNAQRPARSFPLSDEKVKEICLEYYAAASGYDIETAKRIQRGEQEPGKYGHKYLWLIRDDVAPPGGADPAAAPPSATP